MGLPNYLIHATEMVQKRPLKCVYLGQSYSGILLQTKLPMLHEQREEL